jgi:L-asparaginase II
MSSSQHFVPFACMERGGVPESYHFGVGVLADSSGSLRAVWGDPGFVTFPRSALKPFQAVDLIESGAFDALGLGPEHLALACASHMGEPFHVERVRAWLARLECDESYLVCGSAYPGRPEALHAYLRAGLSATPLYYNCSGKHCGFLTNARHLGAPLAAYDAPGHPLQSRYRAVLSRYLGRAADDLPWSRDDCVLPAPAMTMRAMATALARFTADAASAADTPAARILAAMGAHPLLVAGTGCLAPILAETVGGRLIAKTGAEGYLAVFAPAERLGLAMKVADASPRARDAAMIAMLSQSGLIDAAEAAALRERLTPAHCDSRGRPVGRIRPILPQPATAP